MGNWWLMGLAWGGPWTELDVIDPSQTILVFESYGGEGESECRLWGSGDNGFAHGHVKWMRSEEVRKLSAGDQGEVLWGWL